MAGQIASRVRKQRKQWGSAHLLLTQCGLNPGDGAAHSQEGLPSSVHPLWKCPRRHNESGTASQSLAVEEGAMPRGIH